MGPEGLRSCISNKLPKYVNSADPRVHFEKQESGNNDQGWVLYWSSSFGETGPINCVFTYAHIFHIYEEGWGGKEGEREKDRETERFIIRN